MTDARSWPDRLRDAAAGQRATVGPVRLAATLAASASLLFALPIPEHIVQSEVDRAFFVAVAVAEMALAVVLIFAPWWSGSRTERDARLGRAACLAGMLVAGAAVIVFVLTQISGSAHHAAPGDASFDFIGLLPRLVDVALVAVLARLYAVTRWPTPQASTAG